MEVCGGGEGVSVGDSLVLNQLKMLNSRNFYFFSYYSFNHDLKMPTEDPQSPKEYNASSKVEMNLFQINCFFFYYLIRLKQELFTNRAT